jgi:ATP-dependent RNA helicase DHX33
MKGMIACTQPRRVAAITVAMRVSNELNCELGTLVGYSVRFEDVTTEETKIKYMTDGMLLRESINDPLLQRYTVIILDEIHERTLHTDILMGIVKQAQKERQKRSLKPLKLILMSATMDVDQFSKYFNNAPVLYLEGRQHKVDVFHSSVNQTDYLHSAVQTVFQIHRLAPLNEDILVFLTGQDEIETTCKTINEINQKNLKNTLPMIVLPFYAALPSAKQLKVFEEAPADCRKVILSTNIAETSLTIHRIKYVIDTGMIKAKLYTPENNLEILKVHKISKSQAWQRTGRAGREQAGICYRLYTEPQYEELPLNTIPEILRSNLSSVILQLLAIGVQDVLNFDFMDKPNKEALAAAINELELLGAVVKSTEFYELTDLGRKMSQFPLDPKFSRCLLAAANVNECKCVEEILKIVSLLSVDSVFLQVNNNQNKRENANAIRQKFVSADGDPITLLNVYKAFNASKSRKVSVKCFWITGNIKLLFLTIKGMVP